MFPIHATEIFCMTVSISYKSVQLTDLQTLSLFNIKIVLWPSKQLFVFKTSSRHALKTSSTCLQRNNFSSSKTSCIYVLMTSSKTKSFYGEDVLRMTWRHVLQASWRHLLKTSWRHLGDKENVYWGYLYLTMAH